MQSHYALISDVKDYFSLVNKNNIWFVTDQDLEDIKSTLETKLTDSKSDLYRHLTSLNERKKIQLIAALISNDVATIDAFLSPFLKRIPNINIQNLKRISEHNIDEEDLWLNAIIRKIISVMCLESNGYKTSIVDIKRILILAMEKIPDTFISLESKYDIVFEIMHDELKIDTALIADMHIHFSYNEVPKPLKENKFKGSITNTEFFSAMKSKKITESEFIFLTIGLFQNNFSGNMAMEKTLSLMKNNYLLGNYDFVLNSIKNIISTYKEKLLQNISDVILKRISHLLQEPVNENHSRRFFETRLSQLYFGNITKSELTSFSKFSRYFIKKNVSNLFELDATLVSIAELEAEDSIFQRYELLKKQLHLFSIRNRKTKNGFISKTEEAQGLGKINDSVLSRNLGILNSNSPNMADELSKHSSRNRTTDISAYQLDPYASTRKQFPYVGSISGHACFMIALLEDYAKNNSADPNLSRDINQFIILYCMQYISRGYHSLNEVLDLFTETSVKKFFALFNVHFNFSLSQELLDKAFIDTQEYTKQLTLKKTVHEDLQKSYSRLFASRVESFEKIAWLKDKLALATNIATMLPKTEDYSLLDDLLRKLNNFISLKDFIRELENIYIYEKNKIGKTPWSNDHVNESFVCLFINNNRNKYHVVRMLALILKEIYIKYPEYKNENINQLIDKIRNVNNYSFDGESLTKINDSHALNHLRK